MAPRTLIAWGILALIVFAAVFFSYHILNVTTSDSNMNANGGVNTAFQPLNPVVPKNVYAEELPRDREEHHVHFAEPLEPIQEQPKPMPVVVGQTEEDLRALRQVSEIPPPVEYPEPEAKDPMETVVNSESEFGDNLRHPEQMIEVQPPMGSLRTHIPGIEAEDLPAIGGHQSVAYSPEMAQNGGEFMSGIFAFDGSDGGGIGYAMI